MTLSVTYKNSIERCIRDSLMEETISGTYTCDKCHQKSKAKVRNEFIKLPKILILHIKRFDVEGEKIENHTKYPDKLDLYQ